MTPIKLTKKFVTDDLMLTQPVNGQRYLTNSYWAVRLDQVHESGRYDTVAKCAAVFPGVRNVHMTDDTCPDLSMVLPTREETDTRYVFTGWCYQPLGSSHARAVLEGDDGTHAYVNADYLRTLDTREWYAKGVDRMLYNADQTRLLMPLVVDDTPPFPRTQERPNA